MAKASPVYHTLVIVASSSAAEIWLGDDAGPLGTMLLGPSRRVHLPAQPAGGADAVTRPAQDWRWAADIVLTNGRAHVWLVKRTE
jgi:hypothetical protein